jgi:hypothetical protein
MIRVARLVDLFVLAFALGATACSAGDDSPVRRPGTNAQFWTGPFACTTAAKSGYHYPGRPCQVCHLAGKSAPVPFVYSGTIYQNGVDAGAPNIEIAVRDGTALYRTCSARDGNFWVDGTATINWATAIIRVRNDAGVEKSPTTATARNDECSGCHGATTSLLVAP